MSQLADEAVLIGPAPARDSYLAIDRIVAAARQTGAEAIHPGYGFLSENADFAEACAAAGLVFVGPPPAAIRAMGSKSEAKAIMAKAGVPLVPGYHGERQDAPRSRPRPSAIGYPVLIKASAGGGGKGMRIASTGRTSFATRSTRRKREAGSAFGDDRVLIEKYLARPAPYRDADLRRQRTAMSCTSSSATARSSAATRRCSRRRRPQVCRPSAAQADGRRRRRRGRGDRLCGRRHRRVHRRRGRRASISWR